MTKRGTTRHGSLQFYPRCRSKRYLPRVKWAPVKRKDISLLGFIGYKVGMTSVYVRDNSNHSLTKGKRIVIPATIIECPTCKILSVRFYKNNKVIGEVLNSNLDKELKRKLKFPKNIKKKLEDYKDGTYDDVRVLLYPQVKKTVVKNVPDVHEFGLSGDLNQKFEFIKNHLAKEISIREIFKEGLVDLRGITKGKGLQGTVKRFGLTLKAHKSEKGVRSLGSGGPWHPSRVDFTQPRAGQMGFFNRTVYNSRIITVNNINENNINPKSGFKHYGIIKTDYIIVSGSVLGSTKRQLLLTSSFRPSKDSLKKNYEYIELR
jgi:large subunit ribosomal protein L3